VDNIGKFAPLGYFKSNAQCQASIRASRSQQSCQGPREVLGLEAKHVETKSEEHVVFWFSVYASGTYEVQVRSPRFTCCHARQQPMWIWLGILSVVLAVHCLPLRMSWLVQCWDKPSSSLVYAANSKPTLQAHYQVPEKRSSIWEPPSIVSCCAALTGTIEWSRVL
jgi:hypothetical protein